MEQYISKSAFVEEIEKLYNEEIDTYTRNILDRLKSNIDTLKVKEGESIQENPCDGCTNRRGCITCENGEPRETVQKEPVSKVWHDTSELPKTGSIIVINNDRTTLSVEYVGQSLCGVERWAYLDNFLKL